MDKTRVKIFRMIMLAMMVAIGVVISPILRIEGMCPTAHLVNIVCSVLMGPWYSLLCATLIGVIRMMFMGIPPLALTGAVFGALSHVLPPGQHAERGGGAGVVPEKSENSSRTGAGFLSHPGNHLYLYVLHGT